MVRAFAKFLNITNSIDTQATENILITQGRIDDSTLMAAVCNFNNESRTFNYTIDLEQYDLPDGTYYVHSLDANKSLGTFTSINKLLSFSVSVVKNGTRLLLVAHDPSLFLQSIFLRIKNSPASSRT